MTVWNACKLTLTLVCFNISKAFGQDGIPPRVLKECASELAPVLGSFVSFLFKNPNFSPYLETCLSTAYFKEG